MEFRIGNHKVRFTLYALIFPIVTFYYEVVYRLSTVGGIFDFSTVCMLLFSFFFGGITYLFVTAFKSRTATHVATMVLLFLGSIPYLVEYFIYRQFKVFYDVNTVVYGASDAVGGFSGEIFKMIFSFDGFFKISLFWLPTALYFLFGKRLFKKLKVDAMHRIVTVAAMIICYCVSLLFITTNSVLISPYKTEYNYQAAVSKFGLLTGVRLDLKNIIFGDPNDDFAITDTPVSNETNNTQQEVEYGYNQLELNTTGGSGNIKKLNDYVNSVSATKKNKYTGMFKDKNLILITAEAFTAEVIDEKLTPTLYRLANKGIKFTDYYQPASAGTTGGEYQNIFGMLPTSGGNSFKKTAKNYNYMTIASQLNRLGYYGKAFHNNSYTYYSRNETHVNLGYSDGFMGYGNGMEQYVQKAWPQSDLEMIAGTLPTYIDKQPFSVYYMTVSGHSGYSLSGNKMTKKNWEKVQDLPYSDTVKGYIAANLELEAAMAHLVSELEAKGVADDTVICISTDHFPYGLDSDAKLGNMPYLSELYGYEVENYFQRDHSALILWCGSLEKEAPIVVDTPTFSLDILPTLSNLFGTEFDSRLFVGRDVFSDATPLVFNSNYDWKTEKGTYYNSKGKFVPNEGYTVDDDYIKQVKSAVRNKMLYSQLALDNDYFKYLFKK